MLSKSLALLTFVLFILLTQSVNEVQFLNFVYLSALSAAFVALSASCPTIVMVPLRIIYASL